MHVGDPSTNHRAAYMRREYLVLFQDKLLHELLLTWCRFVLFTKENTLAMRKILLQSRVV